jgi:hypothetical protein
MKNSILLWILVAFMAFAIAYVGKGLYQAHEQERAQSVPTPLLPSVK